MDPGLRREHWDGCLGRLLRSAPSGAGQGLGQSVGLERLELPS